MDFLKIGKSVILEEINSLQRLYDRLGDSFCAAVDLIMKTSGKVVFTGVGKSGHIAQKLTSTFNSTGTKSMFLHPAEAIHGDLGIYDEGDVTIMISRSGATDELVRLLPLAKQFSKIIAMVGNQFSPIAEKADLFVDASIAKEADPLGFIPTSSTTVALALGDALACALMAARGFQRDDFFKFHPGGQLGKTLGSRIEDVMCGLKSVAQVSPSASLRQVVIEMTKKPLGAALVFSENSFCGIITDGDIRRALQTLQDIEATTAATVMTKNPICAYASLNLDEAARLMEDRPSQLSVLPVLSESNNKCVGLLRLHDIYGKTS